MARFIIGIDEVGRGSLAGPVTVAAVLLPARLRIRSQKWGAIKDSKKLSPLARELWFSYVAAHPDIRFAYAHVSPRIVDRVNISAAANRAAGLAVRKLARESGALPRNAVAYLDGGLFLDQKCCMLNGASLMPREAITMVKADEKIKAVALASVVAKVKRDRLMRRLAKKYPAYGFEVHKGYGTKRHRAAIREFGPSTIHRMSFAL